MIAEILLGTVLFIVTMFAIVTFGVLLGEFATWLMDKFN